MTKLKSMFLGCASAALCSLGVPVAAEETAPQTTTQGDQTDTVSEQFLGLAKRHASIILKTSPEWATQLGVSQDIGGANFNNRLSDFSVQANEELRELNQTLLKDLLDIDRQKLSGTAAATYDVMLNAYQLAARQNVYKIGIPSILAVNPPYSADQLFGPQVNIPRFFTSQIPLNNKAQLDDYLLRLSQIKRVMDELASMIEVDAIEGATPPKFALDAIVKTARGFAQTDTGNHPIVEAVRGKLGKMDSLNKGEKEQAIEKVTRIVENDVSPAFSSYADRIEKLSLSASNDAGIWKLPNGAELYQIALDSYGANGLTANQIHDIGLDDVKRIHGNMDRILRAQGYDSCSVGERMNALSQDPKVLWPNTDEAKDEILEVLKAHIDTIMDVAPNWFGRIPPQPIEVRRIPVYEEGSAGGAYYTPPSLDGSQPGVFWINLKDTADWPKYSLESLVYHEGVPGHHFQASTQLDIKNMPLIRNMTWFADYGEGWALYVEALAVEMGMYEDDPLGDLGRLKMELYRAARLVVDTGIHHRRWTREQAINWMVEATGETRSSITREVDRYSVWPGQATSYKIGMIKFQHMRKKAQQALGSKFDIRSFHDELLVGGAMPMPVLEARMDSWTKMQKEKKDAPLNSSHISDLSYMSGIGSSAIPEP